MAFQVISLQHDIWWTPGGPPEKTVGWKREMAVTKLTDLTVRSIQTEGTFTDTVVPGLQLRVRTSGAKSWSLRAIARQADGGD
jgi:hypothetical protein